MSKKSKTRTANDGEAVCEISIILKNVRQLQLDEQTGKAEQLLAKIAIGERLLDLKRVTPHGDWIGYLGELGYDTRSAQRLTQIANSDLANEMRTSGTHLLIWLPTDVQKLCTLSALPLVRLYQALNDGWDCDEMSRSQLQAAAKALIGADEESGTGQPQNSAKRDVTNLLRACSRLNEIVGEARDYLMANTTDQALRERVRQAVARARRQLDSLSAIVDGATEIAKCS